MIEATNSSWCESCETPEVVPGVSFETVYGSVFVCRPCLMQIVHVAWDGKVILVETQK